jgi:Flp pilus assembly pilin Flp
MTNEGKESTMNMFWRLLKDERGTETVEWAIVIGLIAMGAILLATSIGGSVTRAFTNLDNEMSTIP